MNYLPVELPHLSSYLLPISLNSVCRIHRLGDGDTGDTKII